MIEIDGHKEMNDFEAKERKKLVEAANGAEIAVQKIKAADDTSRQQVKKLDDQISKLKDEASKFRMQIKSNRPALLNADDKRDRAERAVRAYDDRIKNGYKAKEASKEAAAEVKRAEKEAAKAEKQVQSDRAELEQLRSDNKKLAQDAEELKHDNEIVLQKQDMQTQINEALRTQINEALANEVVVEDDPGHDDRQPSSKARDGQPEEPDNILEPDDPAADDPDLKNALKDTETK